MSIERELGQLHTQFQAIDKRLERVEEKVDRLITFRAMLIGGSMVVSTITTIVVSYLLK